MWPPKLIEATVMNNLRDHYVAQGYDFYEWPPRNVVPAFLGGFQPDAIAVRGKEGVVLKIRSRSVSAPPLSHIAERFSGQPNWQFRVIYFDEPARDEPQENAPSIRLSEHEPRIRTLLREGQIDLALLLAWSVFEGVARSKLRLPRQLAPLQLIEMLESAGAIDAVGAEALRRAAAVRNGLAHGRFDLKPGSGLVEDVLRISSELDAATRVPT